MRTTPFLLADLAHAMRACGEQQHAERLSSALGHVVSHRALAVLVGACARSPLTSVGDPEVAELVTSADMARLAATVPVSEAWQGAVVVAGGPRPVVAAAAPAEPGHLLLLVRDDEDPPADAEELAVVREAWELVTAFTTRTLEVARPADLSTSRAAAGERVRVTAELADAHGATLAGLLGTLRARNLDDRAARHAATDLAASALVELRATAERERELGEETVQAAFDRLRADLAPIVRHTAVELEWAPPPGQVSLPAPVAQAARAIVRSAVLTLLEQGGVRRLRVAWDVGEALEVSVRDDGAGELVEPSLAAGALVDRARAVGGTLELESLPGWGTRLVARLPLRSAAGTDGATAVPLAELHPRELEVLADLARGRRNRQIAEALSISENTVKFHVTNVLTKLGVASRGEAAIVARDAGLAAGPLRTVA
ncbi:MAG: LuxR C-terminal-related transcriptional regulator [Actinomycetota bacterium]|nr:LuxR C-terminal-related transcriptional regulator [Actinomycetota bacterium]